MLTKLVQNTFNRSKFNKTFKQLHTDFNASNENQPTVIFVLVNKASSSVAHKLRQALALVLECVSGQAHRAGRAFQRDANVFAVGTLGHLAFRDSVEYQVRV